MYKARSDLIELFSSDLYRALDVMKSNNLRVLQPNDLGPIASGRTLDDELFWVIERFELDPSDAAILIEARRAEIMSIASADPDLRRAQLDLDVYAWL